MRSIVFSLMLLVALPALGAPEIPPDKAVITFTTKLGVTTFNHQLHTTRAEKCETCHHTHTGDEPIKPCHECHKHEGGTEAPKTKDAIHLRCQGCHEENLKAGNPHGPVKKECKLCHVK